MSDEIAARTDPQISMYLKTSDAEGVSGTELTDFDEGSLETPLLEIEEMNVEDKHEGHESTPNTTPLKVGFTQMSGLRRHAHAIFQWEQVRSSHVIPYLIYRKSRFTLLKRTDQQQHSKG